MSNEILIVDDEKDIRALIAGILEDEGFQTREADGATSALEAVRTRRPSMILQDIWLQGSSMDGLGILREVKKDHPDLPVVMMSGHGTIETAVEALKDGAYDFIEKPFKTDRLLVAVHRAVEAARLRRENDELRLRAGVQTDLLGTSSVMAQVRQAIEKVAKSNSRVLITGPSGAGKEVAARMLHAQSPRAKAPFIVLNCASMDPDRVEMELFGVESPEKLGGQGFRKVGYFEQAHNGTLFLDEVADMPLETQGKIVRVLQEQTFERVGGNSRVSVDVRVVAGSSRDLAEEIAEGKFREDLYYRLSVVPIAIPPLSKRREDIAGLANFFIRRTAESLGHQPRVLGEDAVTALQSYAWPGNVRELRNVVERLLIMAPGKADEPIKADMLPSEITNNVVASLQWGKSAEIMSMPLRQAREIFEREYLLAQMDRLGGNISKTAEFVGMERSALHRKLKSLGVQSEETRKGPR